MGDNVNHPSRYNPPGLKECIVEMEEKFGIEKVKVFCELNAYKYRFRAEMKNDEEDIRKAEWYENRMKQYEGLKHPNRRWETGSDNHYSLFVTIGRPDQDRPVLTMRNRGCNHYVVGSDAMHIPHMELRSKDVESAKEECEALFEKYLLDMSQMYRNALAFYL